MGRWIRRILVIVLVAVFAFSVTYIAVTYFQYRENDRLYEEMTDRFVSMAGSPAGGSGQDGEGGPAREDAPEEELPPITVDFQGLLESNADIIGWLYCEDTPINYPVLKGEDNDQYLRHSYDGAYNMAGSIFVEELNRGDFQDSNTIIYGHHMKNGSMFAVLDKWVDQEFYESHPAMWLLTPERDYRIDLFSSYTTSAYSETYTVFEGACEELDRYLAQCLEKSVFQADVELDGEARYVVLSTCAYVFDNARNVVHGKLVPVDSAGGEYKALQ